MIDVKIYDGYILLQGHAGYEEHGKDIVCAAVSTLAQTLIYSIEELTKDEIEYKMLPGMIEMKYKNLSGKSKTLIDSFFIGVQMIAEVYPENLKLNI